MYLGGRLTEPLYGAGGGGEEACYHLTSLSPSSCQSFQETKNLHYSTRSAW